MSEADLKLEWKDAGNGLITLHKQGEATSVTNIEIKFNKFEQEHSTLWGSTTATLFTETNIANPSSVFDSQGNGIKLIGDDSKKSLESNLHWMTNNQETLIWTFLLEITMGILPLMET